MHIEYICTGLLITSYAPFIRFKSLQKRNVIETRVKAKIVRNPKKRKRLEKRNYKMPWEKPIPLKA